MKPIVCLALAIGLAACGGSDNNGGHITGVSPEIFAGPWAGSADGATVTVTTTQSDTTVSGSGTLAFSGDTTAFSVTGISTPPAISLTATHGDTTVTFVGTYVSRDSVAGTLTANGRSIPFGLRQQ
jgi:hypothetical protein